MHSILNAYQQTVFTPVHVVAYIIIILSSELYVSCVVNVIVSSYMCIIHRMTWWRRHQVWSFLTDNTMPKKLVYHQ